MASKRRAGSDLNHDNWDKEEEPEDPGNFPVASGDELKNRVIKKARRTADKSRDRSNIIEDSDIASQLQKGKGSLQQEKILKITSDDSTNSSSNNNVSKNIFKGFSGFGTNSTAPAFAFLSKLPAATSSGNSDTTTTTSTSTKIQTFSFGSGEDKTNKTVCSDEKGKGDNDYASKVIKLNKSFCDWIVKHVNEQPLCNLLPTFKDYEKFFEDIQKGSKQGQDSTVSKKESIVPVSSQPISSTVTSSNPTTSFFSNFKFNQKSPTTKLSGFLEITNKNLKEQEPSKSNTSEFSFGIKAAEKSNGSSEATTGIISQQTKTNGDSNVETSKPSTQFSFGSALNTQSKSTTGFSFGIKKDEAPTTSGFSFTSGSTPFTFANIKPPVTEPPKEENANGNEEDDEPPKVEIKEIVEEDAFFTKRCKIFVKKDNAFKDCGIGTFYLKPVKDSEKTQLLVRSSNNLGTILVNVILAEGMPTQRMGKNNVMLVHPGSGEDTKPQTTLIRVKDGPEADELLEMINKHKK